MIRVSLIVPARNEVESIGATVRSFHTALVAEQISHEIIVVDDCSTDGTGLVVRTLMHEIPGLILISRTGVAGFGSAVRTGFAHARGEYVTLVMADGSDYPSDLIAYCLKADEGYDCVFGSRFLHAGSVARYPYWKYFLNRTGNYLISVLFGIHYYDVTNAFKLYRKSRVDALSLTSTGFDITVELPLKAIESGCSFSVIPIYWQGRTHGVSKMRIVHTSLMYLFRVFQLWFKRFRFSIVAVVCAWAALLYHFVHATVAHSVNIPYQDQWIFVDVLSKPFHLWETLAFQHNEHRIGIGLLLTQVLARCTEWNQYGEIMLVNLIIVASLCVFTYLYYHTRAVVRVSDVLLPLICLNVLQIENLIWGFQIAFVLPLFFLSLWLLSLHIKNERVRVLSMTVLSFASAFSSLHGLILSLFTLGYVLWSHKKEWLFIVLNAAVFIVYWVGFQSHFQASLTLVPNVETVRYAIMAVSGGFFYFGNNLWVNYTLTGCLLGVTFVGILNVWNKNVSRTFCIYGLSIILYALVFVVLIAVGRSSLGLEQAFSSRYVTFTMLLPLGIFFILSSFSKGELGKFALLFLLIAHALIYTDRIVSASSLKSGKEAVLNCYLHSPLGAAQNCNTLFSLFPDRSYINERTDTVRTLKGMLH